MSTLFSTCLLVGGGSNAPELVSSEVNLHPGDVFVPDQDENVLIAGGFPSIYQESGILLSPTLFMNFRLGDFTTGGLEKIAVAEYDRANSMNYTAWTVEPDNRLCVVSKDTRKLEEFVDTYGGVLDIRPVLLSGCHPEYPTALEIDVDSRDGMCRVESRFRAVLDTDRCTYCGTCGRVCPEQCIDPRPYIDLTSCTMCKACEESCPTGAIDLHGAVDSSIEVPALLCLDPDMGTELRDQPNVYGPDDLKEYFGSLFPFRMEETISWSGDLCQYSAKFGRGCDLCYTACLHGAISLGKEGVKIDAAACVECGSCLGVCPTGALQNGRFDDAGFVNYIESCGLDSCKTIVMGSESGLRSYWWRTSGAPHPATFFLEYTPIQGLSLFHYMYLLGRGIRQVVVLEPPEKLSSGQHKQIDLARKLAATFGNIENFVTCTVDPETVDATVNTTLRIDTVLPGAELSAEGNRRYLLVDLLAGMVSASGRELGMDPKSYLPFATVTCREDRCTQCMACLNECRIQALYTDEEAMTLRHLPARCVGCGLCSAVCPENALSLSPQFSFDNQFFTEKQMAAAEPMKCKGCGKVFGTRKAFEKVMTILKSKETVDTEHFQYCDTCRVTRLFETE